MAGTRKAKLVAKETISNVQNPEPRRRHREVAAASSVVEEDEVDLMPPPTRQRRKAAPKSGNVQKSLFETVLNSRVDMQVHDVR